MCIKRKIVQNVELRQILNLDDFQVQLPQSLKKNPEELKVLLKVLINRKKK